MAKRYFRKMAALAKMETSYATDPVPTGAANALVPVDVNFTPLAGEEVSRDLYLPWLGHQGVQLVGTHAMLEFGIEIAGSGAAGTAPPYGPLLRACGLSETVTAGEKVEYQPVSAGYESAAFYWNMDGVNHILLGGRGNVSLQLTPKQIPRYRFQLWGLQGTIVDAALPTVVTNAWQKALPVSKVNTPICTLHGHAAIAESLAIDLGNKCEPRMLIGEDSIQIVDRQSTGTAVFESASLATIDWFARAKARTRGALAVTHGTVAGNIVDIAAPAVEIGRPTHGNTQGIVNYSLPLALCWSAGDDELKITVR